MNPIPLITEDRKLALYRLTSLISSLFPNQPTHNPYFEKTQQLTKKLSIEDKLLFHDVLHSITLLNATTINKSTLQSSETDLLNAIKLILPKSLQLTERHLNLYEQLYQTYNTELFTYVEACSRLKPP
ncbi:MAG: hypothetical protein ACFB2Y_03965 [Fulvivirga sp.]